MQVVRHREIQHIQIGSIDELAPVLGEGLHGGDTSEPVPGRRARVRHRDDARGCRVVDELLPSSAHDGELPAHQPSADDADPDGACGHDAASTAAAAVASVLADDADAVVGVAEIVREAYPDIDPEGGDWSQVDLRFVKSFERPVPLAEIKANAGLQDLLLLRQSRLSTMPISKKHFDLLCRLGGARA